uniref:Uncharacterized protein n=1 Tax=Anguilla anguilla TaxID=7936 RepID=A0A0E9Y2S8_ANGAN
MLIIYQYNATKRGTSLYLLSWSG